MYREGIYMDDAESNNEEVIYSRDPKIVNYSWTKEATRLLIGIRTQLDAEFDDPNQRKMDLWEKISLALKEHGFDFPPSICDKKWRNLLVSFRRTISRGTQGKLGRFPYTWEFYEDLLGYWTKKDPVGVNLALAATATQNDREPEDDDNLDDNEFDSFQEENLEEEDVDDSGDAGDLNKFLTVTLTESDDDGGHEGTVAVERRGDVGIRPRHNQTSKIESLEISAVPYSPSFKRSDSPPIQSRKFPLDIKQVHSNNRSTTKFRPTPTITIEEVRPMKRKLIKEEDDDDVDGLQQNSMQALALNNSQLNISYLERSAENNHEDYSSGTPLSKSQRREESPPPSWLSHLKAMEESAQRRWEVTEARQIREYKQKRELDLQLLQTMQNLSSVLVKMTEET